MATLWTTPRTWGTNDPVTATFLNQQLRDNLTFLKSPPKSFVTIRNGANINITSTTIAAVDDAQFTLEIETSGGDVEIWFHGSVQSVANVVTHFDVLIDGTTYLSSGTGTPLTSGVGVFAQVSSILVTGIHTWRLRYALAAGVHTLKLRARTASGTAVLLMANMVTQFGVIER